MPFCLSLCVFWILCTRYRFSISMPSGLQVWTVCQWEDRHFSAVFKDIENLYFRGRKYFLEYAHDCFYLKRVTFKKTWFMTSFYNFCPIRNHNNNYYINDTFELVRVEQWELSSSPASSTHFVFKTRSLIDNLVISWCYFKWQNNYS